MLKILDTQLEALGSYALMQFRRRTVRRLRDQHGLRTKGWTDTGLDEMVGLAMARATRYGLLSERDLGMYIDLSLLFGVRFETSHPSLATLLSDPERSTLEKVDGVFATLGSPPEPTED